MRVRPTRIGQEGDDLGIRHELAQDLQALPFRRNDKLHDASYIAARTVDAGSKPEPYGIIASKSDDGNARCSGLGNQRRYRPAGRHDDINAAADELGGEWRQPIIEAVCPHIINHDVLAFDKPELFETAAECRQEN